MGIHAGVGHESDPTTASLDSPARDVPAHEVLLEPAPDLGAFDREERRQRAVEALGLTEGVRDERLDRITRLAQTVFKARMSTITILDQQTAWFPGAAGFEPTEMPRRDTFCNRTTEEDVLTIVPDATVDPRFSDLPIVIEGGVRFYAGAPLRDSLGNVVGVFCVFDPDVKLLQPDELTAFQDMAAWAQQELVASNEMTAASRVQASMLPDEAIRVDDWDVSGVCLPALAVGGDFYDYGVDNDVVHVTVGDVMGKGTGAALVGAGVRAAMRGTHSAITAGVDLGITTTQVARSLMADLERSESFVTLVLAAIDLDDGFLRYVDAGMGLALLVRADGRIEQLSGDDHPFGVLRTDHWTEHHASIEPGDKLLVFSDGLLDLVDDPVQWWRPIGGLVAAHEDAGALLRDIATLARTRTALDDVTAVAVFRRPGDPGTGTDA